MSLHTSVQGHGPFDGAPRLSTAATFCSTLVDEWARAGVTDAVICPGSRSTPLVEALDRDDRIRAHIRLDERSAGFFALGMAVASKRPVVAVTTSGTAAVEMHPAVVEADLSRIALIICTADRPVELHDVGAPQTLDQSRLYGNSLRWSVSLGVPEERTRVAWRSLAARLVAEASYGPKGPGPVHANLSFAEPLTGRAGELPPGRQGGLPWHLTRARQEVPSREVIDTISSLKNRRGIIVAGGGRSAPLPSAVLSLAGALSWPVLADPRSGARRAHKDAVVIAAADALLREERFAKEHKPEVVLHFGQPWASKALGSWLAGCGALQILVDPYWAWGDPDRVADQVISASPDAVCELVIAELAGGDGGPIARQATPWEQSWSQAEALAQAAIGEVLQAQVTPSEPGVARALWSALGEGDSLVVSSSMPIRDLEWFAPVHHSPPEVISNRGANGIDGVLSTALGVAAARASNAAIDIETHANYNPVTIQPDHLGVREKGIGDQRIDRGRTAVLLGDLAFLHDISALSCVSVPPCMVIVVVDNRGGGIFSFLPQAGSMQPDRFERLMATPPVVDIGQVVSGFGLSQASIEGADIDGPIRKALSRLGHSSSGTMSCLQAVRVVTQRSSNVELHDLIAQAVGESLSAKMA